MLLLLWLVEVVVGTRRGGGSCAAARKCCDGKDPDCAVPSVSEEDASKRHGEKKTEKLLPKKIKKTFCILYQTICVHSAVCSSCFVVACDF